MGVPVKIHRRLFEEGVKKRHQRWPSCSSRQMCTDSALSSAQARDILAFGFLTIWPSSSTTLRHLIECSTESFLTFCFLAGCSASSSSSSAFSTSFLTEEARDERCESPSFSDPARVWLQGQKEIVSTRCS